MDGGFCGKDFVCYWFNEVCFSEDWCGDFGNGGFILFVNGFDKCFLWYYDVEIFCYIVSSDKWKCFVFIVVVICVNCVNENMCGIDVCKVKCVQCLIVVFVVWSVVLLEILVQKTC